MAGKFITFLFLVLQLHLVHGHPPGLSSADVTINKDKWAIKVTFAGQDIEALVPMDADGDAEVTDQEMDAVVDKISAFMADEIKIKVDGNEVKPKTTSRIGLNKEVNTFIEYPFTGQLPGSVSIEAGVLAKLPEGHKQYVTVKDANGNEIGNKMLEKGTPLLEIDLASGTTVVASVAQPSSTFTDFLKLGIEHILTGYDHLLFLFSLLVVTQSFWPAVKIITFFTIAHSITLALAGLNIIDIAPDIIEPLIAATIVYVGLENIIRKDKVTTRQRCILTFFFGLIHGFGFAGVLKEMGISSIQTGILVPLFSFNLGVETGQIAVAGIVLPLIWRLHHLPVVSRYLVPVGSVLTCLAGGYWLLERTLLR